MNKENFVLKTLSLLSEKNFSPVQVQKLFFLVQKKLNVILFDFKAHNYGPYSTELQSFLDKESRFGGIEIQNINGINYYQINKNKIQDAEDFDEDKKRNIIDLANHVKSLSFKDLCMSIYEKFPEMAENSVFFKNKNQSI